MVTLFGQLDNYPNLLKLQKKGLRVTFSSCKAPSRPLLQKVILLDTKKINDFLVSTFSFNLRSKSLTVYFKDYCTCRKYSSS